MKGMAFATIAQLALVVLVLSVVILLIVTQLAGLGGELNRIEGEASDSTNTSLNIHGSSICRVAGGECAEECVTFATKDHEGGCPEGMFCCSVVAGE